MTENVPPNAPDPPAPFPASWTAAARLLRPQGRRGELLAEPLTDVPGVFDPGRPVLLPATTNAPALESAIESSWSPTGRNAGRIVLKLTGIDSISAAELHAGRELHVLTSDLPPLEPDTWFVRDLIGCKLFDREELIGEIAGVQYAIAPDGHTRLPDAAPLLEVTVATDSQSHPATPDSESDPALIPFIKSWLDSVDLAVRRVTMHLPPGLLELSQLAAAAPEAPEQK